MRLCCVVVEGGPGTLQTAYEAITRNTPVIIFNKTGRIADILAYGYLKSKPVKDASGYVMLILIFKTLLLENLRELIVVP